MLGIYDKLNGCYIVVTRKLQKDLESRTAILGPYRTPIKGASVGILPGVWIALTPKP